MVGLDLLLLTTLIRLVAIVALRSRAATTTTECEDRWPRMLQVEIEQVAG